MYIWDNKVCNEPEYELQVFTEGRLYDLLEKTIKENHQYKVPQIICLPMINTTNEWVNGCLIMQEANYAKKDPARSKEAQHGTYIVNYTVRLDWGEVANYVESYVIIVEGHLLLEITSMADKIFVTFMQLIKTSKYVNALGNVLDELGIPYKIEGPFEKNIVKHELPE